MRKQLAEPPPNLLAKTRKFDGDGKLKQGCLLVDHTRDVVTATKKIIQVLSNDLQRFFKLTEEQMPQLIATSVLAAFCHDIGKANDGFIAMLEKKGKQAIRHEHLSALVMSCQKFREWIKPVTNVDYEIARLVVAGYHLKTAVLENTNPRLFGFAQKLRGVNTDTVIFYSQHGHSPHPQFGQWLELLRKEFSLTPPDFDIPSRWSFSRKTANAEYIHENAERIVEEFAYSRRQIDRQRNKEDWSRMRLWMTVKSVLIAADAAASAMRRKGLGLEEWIETSLDVCATTEDLKQLKQKYKVTVEARERKRNNPGYRFVERKFQTETADLGKCAALLTSCGSGKTYAGYLWAQKQIEDIKQNRKIIFLYPTTNTAAQGFKDYASHEAKATLITSRAEFDLVGMFENPDDNTTDERGQNDYTTDKELFALGHWDRSICVATVDAFLGFMQNSYTSLCLLPVLTRSVVVIDEVHSFDYAMFAALVEFLERFDVPILLMSASLPKGRRTHLHRKFPKLAFYPQDEDLASLPDLLNAMSLPRYRISHSKNNWEAAQGIYCPLFLLDIARQKFNENCKVLWVVNTVDRCIGIAQALEQQDAYCYHSRFLYEHRRDIHDAVVEKFHPDSHAGVIAITTQVCEMSLDLDADVLITEIAPATSLIQRMGRCNRKTTGRDDGEPGQVFIYPPPGKNGKPSHNPYEPDFFQTGEELLSKLNLSELISQENLAETLKNVGVVDDKNKICKFTTPDWVSISENDFRDTDELTVPAVLESMRDEFLRLKEARESVAGILLQAPIGYAKEKIKDTWVRLVPDETESYRYKYCKKYGLREVKQNESKSK